MGVSAKEMAPRESPTPRDLAHSQQPAKEANCGHSQYTREDPRSPRRRAAYSRLRGHAPLAGQASPTPQEMLDPRERKVLRQLRSAVRSAAGDEGEGL